MIGKEVERDEGRYKKGSNVKGNGRGKLQKGKKKVKKGNENKGN